MNKSKALGAVLVTGLLICLVAAAAPAENIRVLSGQNLLRLIRQRGGAPKPAYENRLEQPVVPAEPEVVEVPETPEEPEPPEEPEIPEEFTIIELPTEPTVSDIDVLVPEPAPTPVPTPTPAPAPMPKPAGDSLLEMVPAESLFCVRINSFDFTLSQIDQFLAGAVPIPMTASMLVRMQLAQVLGNPELKGLNTAESFVVFALAPPGEAPTADDAPDLFGAFLVPVTDYRQFVGGNPNISPLGTKGTYKITSLGMPTMLIAQAGDSALVSLSDKPKHRDQLTETAKSISQRKLVALTTTLDTSEAEKAAKEPIWIYYNIELAAPFLEQAISSELEGLMTMGGAMAPGGQPGMSPAAALSGLDLDKIMKQVRFFSLTLNPKPNVLSINYTISAVAGTEMAKTLSADSATVLAFGQMLGGKDPKKMGPQLKSISALIPNADQADFVGTHNLIDLIKKGAAFSPMPMPQIDAKAKSSVAFAVKVGNGALSADIALPKEHLAEIIASFMKLQPIPGQPMTPRPNIPPEAFIIEPGVGMGSIRFGRSIDMASQILGRPDNVKGNANEYHSLGLAIVMSSRAMVTSILCGDAGSPDSPLIEACQCRTKKGIAMGSGRREVRKAYGRPSSTKTNDIPGQGKIVVLEYKRIGAQFTFRDDKVVHMIFRQSRPASR
ncbi:MAG: hypothetical protein ACYSX1_00320 [Planctomycetota bacterium]|jgi:hypothetical protein